jgi:DNA transposition AAA+ family ATPase
MPPSVNASPITETIVTRRISEALDYAAARASLVVIRGPTGRGKTLTAMTWAAEKKALYVRAPSSCTRRVFAVTIAEAVGIRGSANKTTAEIEAKLAKAMPTYSAIVVDEAGHLLPKGAAGSSAIELVRDLHDSAGIGAALIFTDVYIEEMRSGRLSRYYEQFIGRVKFEVAIPSDVRRDEAEAIVKAHRPDAPAALVSLALKIARARDGRLRVLCEDLRRAADWAATERRPMTSDDLSVAADWRLSGGLWPTE